MKFEKRKEGWLFLAAMLFIVSCTAHKVVTDAPAPAPSPAPTPLPAPAPAPSEPLEPSCASGQWCYSGLVSPLITNAMITADVSMVCKKAPLDRRRMWTHIVQAISFAESNYKYASEYQENFYDDYTKKNAVSIGMLQLSISDKRKASPGCKALTEVNIRQPKQNLICGVETMHWLVTRAGSKHSFLDLGAYWSVARPKNANGTPNTRHQVVLKKLRELEPSC